jgi:uncharacterized protein YjbI with pentapeptide repeats
MLAMCASRRRNLSRVALVSAVSVAAAATWSGTLAGATQDLELQKQRLEVAKLSEEVRELRERNERQGSLAGALLAYVGFAGVAAAVIGAAVPIWKEIRERNRQQALDREQRERELQQSQLESQRRSEERLAEAVANLGADSESVRVSGAIALAGFLRGEHEALHGDVYRVLCANLRLDHSEAVNRFLVKAFEDAVRSHLESAAAGKTARELDLVRCVLRRIDLSGLDLTEADLAFAKLDYAILKKCVLVRARGLEVELREARLSDADLTEARFRKARCPDAHFHRVRLVSADFREADLARAEFFGAQLQGAHFDKADVRGARFDDANLKDAYFPGAKVNEATLKSLRNARGETWRDAHFADAVRAKLEGLDAS